MCHVRENSYFETAIGAELAHHEHQFVESGDVVVLVVVNNVADTAGGAVAAVEEDDEIPLELAAESRHCAAGKSLAGEPDYRVWW